MKKLATGQQAPNFHLPGVDGNEYSLDALAGKKAIVVVFTCNHCPYAKAYEDRLIALQNEFADRGVQFLAVNANDDAGYPEDSFDNMVRRAKDKSFPYPYLRDKSQRVAHAFGAEYTPEVFVLNDKHEVCYIGRVDDNWQQPDKVRSHDLRTAIEAVLKGEPVQNPVTHAVGCTIKWKL